MKYLTLPLVFLALGSAACVVPATRYDEARSALALEQAANRQSSQRLYAMEAKVASLQAELDKRQRDIDAQGAKIAQTELDTSVASRKEEDAEQMVDQLRGELERVGDHLRAFADQKEELAQALDAAEARAKRLSEAEHAASERALVVRDLSLLLRDPIATGEIDLVMVEGRPTLRISSARVLDDKGDVRPEAKPWLAAVARASRLHPGSTVSIAERGHAEGETAAASAVGLGHISDALAAEGLAAGRVTLDVPPAASTPKDAPPAPAAAKDAPVDAKASLPEQATIEIAIS